MPVTANQLTRTNFHRDGLKQKNPVGGVKLISGTTKYSLFFFSKILDNIQMNFQLSLLVLTSPNLIKWPVIVYVHSPYDQLVILWYSCAKNKLTLSEISAIITAWFATWMCSVVSKNIYSYLYFLCYMYLPQFWNLTNPKNRIQSDAYCGLCAPVYIYIFDRWEMWYGSGQFNMGLLGLHDSYGTWH